MRIDFRWTVAGLALLAAGCNKSETTATPAAGNAASAVATPAPSGQDWTETVSETPEGGFRMGNPDAAVKLVEYASLTCPHCAAFAKEAVPPLEEQFIRSGRVSWEYRPFVLNAIDVSATLLARCQGPGPFFKLVEQVYAEQENWVAKFQTMSPADQTRIQGLPEQQQFEALAKAGQLDTFFGSRGVPSGKAAACLTDKAGLDRIVAIRDLGSNQDKISGTPAFLVNGALADGVHDWATLKAKLDTELAG